MPLEVLPVFVEIKRYIQQFITVVFYDVVAISIKNHLFFSTLFNQIYNVDVVVYAELLVEMFLESYLSFCFI